MPTAIKTAITTTPPAAPRAASQARTSWRVADLLLQVIDAPDQATAMRAALGAACARVEALEQDNATLTHQLWELQQGPLRATIRPQAAAPATPRTPRKAVTRRAVAINRRPAIRTLLQERAIPLNRSQIEQAMEMPSQALAKTLRAMVTGGQLLLADGNYTLPVGRAIPPTTTQSNGRGGNAPRATRGRPRTARSAA